MYIFKKITFNFIYKKRELQYEALLINLEFLNINSKEVSH